MQTGAGVGPSTRMAGRDEIGEFEVFTPQPFLCEYLGCGAEPAEFIWWKCNIINKLNVFFAESASASEKCWH